MDTTKLKKFAQFARRTLIAQVSARLDAVLDPASAARREHPKAADDLEKAIKAADRDAVIERVAYTWFNRFSALRYMDVNNINGVRIVSPLPGAFQPEILADAKAGIIDDRVPEKTAKTIRDLLDGRAPSPDPQAESYRALLVAICNDWHKAMPFMFERIEDYTELLMPEDLLSNNSILAYTREAMTPDACEDVEIIGWLYQFYISEKKDEVFAGLKKNKKIEAENIPAATQLFTPHWIVRYLVENSLGRLWMLNHPASNLTDKMEYYIAPVEPEDDFLRVASPEEIKICDPACGSGHMLTYAFDLLHAIYEEEGYDPSEIPALILTHNLFGIEIDERAGALAAFALTMKARGKQRRFFRKSVRPNICVLQDVSFEPQELADYTAEVGRDLFTSDLRETLGQFTEAKNFGSLIVPALKDVAEVARVVDAQDFEGNLFLRATHNRVQSVLRMADYLSPKYHVVVANPPYMGKGGMNAALVNFTRSNYSASKADLFAAFMERGLRLAATGGNMAMLNMQAWMFISSYEKLRAKLLSDHTILSMIHLGERAFDTIGGAVVSTTAFTFQARCRQEKVSEFVRLTDGRSESQKQDMLLEALNNRASKNFYVSSPQDFEKIPGEPIAYWLSEQFRRIFKENERLGDKVEAGNGLQTNDNNLYLRQWHEVDSFKLGVGISTHDSASSSKKKWFPYNKGGEFRRWYGNYGFVIDWQDDGKNIKERKRVDLAAGRITANNSKCWNEKFYFERSVNWSDVTSGKNSFRYSDGSLFDITAPSAFPEGNYSEWFLLSFLNSSLCGELNAVLNPTLHFNVGNFRNLPALVDRVAGSGADIKNLVKAAQSDWDAYETSWDFTTLPLLAPDTRQPTLAATYASLRQHWQQMTDEMQRLEQENNRIFIDAYGLADELDADVPLEEITLTCNPAYRYRGNDDLEGKLRADTLREFLSYAVGCMFGRYSLDAPGLILANQGETLADYLARVPNPTFTPDEDNVIPILDGDWFPDDITERFRRFLSVTFGADNLQDNLAYIEEALGKNGKPRTIRDYFVKDFYTDHVKRYKKRPIYWLFASPKGTFQALIYMHRYREDTVSVVLNDYLRAFTLKLEGHRRAQEALSISPEASQSQRTKAIKEIEKVSKQITELEAWERDVLFPLASRKVAIDLDDGVKVNYPKFGAALKKIVGVS